MEHGPGSVRECSDMWVLTASDTVIDSHQSSPVRSQLLVARVLRGPDTRAPGLDTFHSACGVVSG